MAIPMLKIRRPNGRLIFNMGIPIPGKDGLYIETGPCWRKLYTRIHVSFGQKRLTWGEIWRIRDGLPYGEISNP